MTIKIALILLGSFIFLFVFWRRLKEDYFENQIFSTGFYILALVALANLLSWRFAQNYWFWFSLVGLIAGIVIGRWRFHLRFFEVLEAVISAIFAPIILLLLYDGINSRRSSSFFAICIITALIGLYYLLNSRYKTFSWYRSGRVGFSGLTVLGTFFLIRALVAIWFPTMLSFANADWLISAGLAFLSFLALVNLTLRRL